MAVIFTHSVILWVVFPSEKENLNVNTPTLSCEFYTDAPSWKSRRIKLWADFEVTSWFHQCCKKGEFSKWFLAKSPMKSKEVDFLNQLCDEGLSWNTKWLFAKSSFEKVDVALNCNMRKTTIRSVGKSCYPLQLECYLHILDKMSRLVTLLWKSETKKE